MVDDAFSQFLLIALSTCDLKADLWSRLLADVWSQHLFILFLFSFLFIYFYLFIYFFLDIGRLNKQCPNLYEMKEWKVETREAAVKRLGKNEI